MFGRWHRGRCVIFDEKIDPETNEKYIPFTFNDEIVENPVIINLKVEILQKRENIKEKIKYIDKSLIQKLNFKVLFDKASLQRLERTIERNQDVQLIESSIKAVSQQRDEIMSSIKDFFPNYFI
jgi:hypothetical protein